MRTLIFSTFAGLASLTGTAFACPNTTADPLSTAGFASLTGIETLNASVGSDVQLSECGGLDEDLALQVAGNIDDAPTATLTFTDATAGGFYIGSRSACDTVMLVEGPDGSYFSDDDGSARQPLIALDGAAGDYRVWLGQYNADEMCDGQIVLTPADQTCPMAASASATLDLSSGSASQRVTAGGPFDIAACSAIPGQFGGPARAMVAAQANLEIAAANFADESLTLSINNECDTSLVAMSSGGTWYYNDDDSSYNPALSIPARDVDGLKVWAGTFGQEGCEVEISANAGAAIGTCPAAGMVADQTISTGPDGLATQSFNVTMGSTTDLNECNENYDYAAGSGFVDAQPQLSIDVTPGFEGDIHVTGVSSCDGVMLVSSPDGQWLYSDDASGTDPGLYLSGNETGTYTVWLGSYGGDACEATLAVEAAVLSCPSPDLDAKATISASLDALVAGIDESVVAGGYTDMYQCDNQTGLFGSGYVMDRPDFSVNLDLENSSQISFETYGNCDTILLVNGPDGQWYYSDDDAFDSNGGLVAVPRAENGDYQVWVGTYGEALCEGGLKVERGLIKE